LTNNDKNNTNNHSPHSDFLLLETVPMELLNPPAEAEAPQTPSPPNDDSPAEEKRTPVKTKPIEKFGTQTEKGKVIYAFRNGDKHHKGVKIIVHPTKFKNFDQVDSPLSFLFPSTKKLNIVFSSSFFCRLSKRSREM
jgi:hypothetical protein